MTAFAACGMLAGGATGGAFAATLSAQELLQQFNLITTGDVTGNSGLHIDGRALVGGDFDSAGSVVYMNGKGSASDYAGLTVAGDVKAPVQVNNGGGAAVGGGAANVALNGGGTKAEHAPVPVPENYAKTLSAYANQLAAMGASTGVTRHENRFDVSGTGSPIAVLSLAEADLLTDRDFNVTFGGATDWLVVNIAATAVDRIFSLGSTFKAQQGMAAMSHVVWNFIGYDKVIFDALFQGIILADGAQVVTNAGNIEGNIFAASFDGRSELHYLDGSNPPPGGDTPVVPLPAGLPLLLGGFGLLAGLRRRSRR